VQWSANNRLLSFAPPRRQPDYRLVSVEAARRTAACCSLTMAPPPFAIAVRVTVARGASQLRFTSAGARGSVSPAERIMGTPNAAGLGGPTSRSSRGPDGHREAAAGYRELGPLGLVEQSRRRDVLAAVAKAGGHRAQGLRAAARIASRVRKERARRKLRIRP